MWDDLQQVFFIIFGPFIFGLLLPVFIGAGVLLAATMSVIRFWQPTTKVEIVSPDREIEI